MIGVVIVDVEVVVRAVACWLGVLAVVLVVLLSSSFRSRHLVAFRIVRSNVMFTPAAYVGCAFCSHVG